MCLLFYCWRCQFIASKERDSLINEQIRAKEVMVIGPKGEQLGTKNIKDALTLANYAGFDLVLTVSNTTLLLSKSDSFISPKPLPLASTICT